MKLRISNSFARRLALAAALLVPELAGAQYFNYNPVGDVVAGFRKTGAFATSYNLVVDYGNVTNFLNLPPGKTLTMTNLTATSLTYAFSDYNNLQWSVFDAFPNGSDWQSAIGTFPFATMWYTLPGTDVGTQTVPPVRLAQTAQERTTGTMLGVGTGANSISAQLKTTNAENNTLLVDEPLALIPNDTYNSLVNDPNSGDGDFGESGYALPYNIENLTPASFTAPQRSDFYQVVPRGLVDPISGSTNAMVPYFVGYFILNPAGTMTFTRGFSVSSTTTAGSAPLKVVFSTTATNTSGATNWVWNFGDGTIITNTTSASVTNTYTTGGTYTVTLTIGEPGGPQVLTLAGYVVVTSTTVSTPRFSSVSLVSGAFVVAGTNGTPSTQYRILSSTNLNSGTWTPVYTNQFSGTGAFGYTNNSPTGGAAFYKLISP